MQTDNMFALPICGMDGSRDWFNQEPIGETSQKSRFPCTSINNFNENIIFNHKPTEGRDITAKTLRHHHDERTGCSSVSVPTPELPTTMILNVFICLVSKQKSNSPQIITLI
jgi:hypothetical protein